MAMLAKSSFIDQAHTTSTTDFQVIDIKCHFNKNYKNFKTVNGVFYFEEHMYIQKGYSLIQIL